MHLETKTLCRSLFAGLAAMSCAAIAPAAEPARPADAQARYQQERAACLSGQSHQDQPTCLKEAGAALEEARRGRLADGPAQYQQNALARCAALPGDQRSACEARMHGAGTTSGSVAGGGIYRELIVREVPSDTRPAQ
jgi:hypothetical protein